MRRYTYNQGAVTPMAIIFVMVSMLITVGYLKYSLTSSAMERYRFAMKKAKLMAQTGINKEGIPILSYYEGGDSVIISGSKTFKVKGENQGAYFNVHVGTSSNEYGKTQYYSYGHGKYSYKGFSGKMIVDTSFYAVIMEAADFSKYMYFTNSEEPGGGPYTDGTVTFGRNDVLEGIIHTNGHITMSSSGCPTFSGKNTILQAVDGFSLGSCNYPDSLFDQNPRIVQYPPDGVATTIAHANWIYTGNDLLFRGALKDTLIMTQIEFVRGGYKVSQWTYLIPPVAVDGPPPEEFIWDTGGTTSGIADGHANFDLPFDNSNGYLQADTLILSRYDSENNPIANTMLQYSVGDTVIVSSKDTLTKFWKGIILSKNLSSGVYLIGVNTLEQAFGLNGFLDGELVDFTYKAPLDPDLAFNRFESYHNHPNDNGQSVCTKGGFHHFDFEPGPDGPDIIQSRMVYSKKGVIYVHDSQLRVKGVVDGNFTIVTDAYTEYRRHDDPTIIDRVWDNIWLIDDVRYIDSDRNTGEVVDGTPNRLGLVSGANVIIANTKENGAKGQAFGHDIIINAAILALNESFVAQYWQNSLSNPAWNGPNVGDPISSHADGRGPFRNPISTTPVTTGTDDKRGIVHLWGSINQDKRGYMLRNLPGPYNAWPGIGYDKDYHYDYNFSTYFGPTYYPIVTDENGRKDLVMNGYGASKIGIIGPDTTGAAQ